MERNNMTHNTTTQNGMRYDSSSAYWICKPIYNLLRLRVPIEDRGPTWEDLTRVTEYQEVIRWNKYADRLQSMADLADQYGAGNALGMLADDYLIECGTVSN